MGQHMLATEDTEEDGNGPRNTHIPSPIGNCSAALPAGECHAVAFKKRKEPNTIQFMIFNTCLLVFLYRERITTRISEQNPTRALEFAVLPLPPELARPARLFLFNNLLACA